MSFFRSFINDANRSVAPIGLALVAEDPAGLMPSLADTLSAPDAAPLRSETLMLGVAGFEAVEPPVSTQDGQVPESPAMQKTVLPLQTQQPVIEAKPDRNPRQTVEPAVTDEEKSLLPPHQEAVAQAIEHAPSAISENNPVLRTLTTPSLRATPPRRGDHPVGFAATPPRRGMGASGMGASETTVHETEAHPVRTEESPQTPETETPRTRRSSQEATPPIDVPFETHEHAPDAIPDAVKDRPISDISAPPNSPPWRGGAKRRGGKGGSELQKGGSELQKGGSEHQEGSSEYKEGSVEHQEIAHKGSARRQDAHKEPPLPEAAMLRIAQDNEAAMAAAAIQQAEQALGFLSSFAGTAEKPLPVREKSEPQVQIGTIEVIVESAPAAMQQSPSPNTGFMRDPGRYYLRRLYDERI